MTAKFWVGGTGTWDTSTTTNWSLSSGGASGAAVPVAGDTVTFDSSSGTGTVTVNNSSIPNLSTFTMSGTQALIVDFSANNNNISVTTGNGFVLSGSGMTLKMGNGTWTTSIGNGNVWNSNGLGTLTANSSTIVIPAQSNGNPTLFFANGQSINNLTIGPFSNQIWLATINVASFGTVTIAGTLTLSPPVSVTFSAATVVSGTLTASGTSFSNCIDVDGGGGNLKPTVNHTFNWAYIRNHQPTNAGTATNSFNGGNNSNMTITGPSGGGIISG